METNKNKGEESMNTISTKCSNRAYDNNNQLRFFSMYATNLQNAVEQFPEEYSFIGGNIELAIVRMFVAFKKGTYNKDSRAIKATCKQLNLKHTYKAINNYLRGEEDHDCHKGQDSACQHCDKE